MIINLTKLLDSKTRVVRLSTPDETNTTDGSWYVNNLEGTSPNQAYSFIMEDEDNVSIREIP